MRRLSFLFAVSSLTLLANDVPGAVAGLPPHALDRFQNQSPAASLDPHALNLPKLFALQAKGLEAQVRVSGGGCVVPMPTVKGDSRIDSKSLLPTPKSGIEPLPTIQGKVCQAGR